VFSFEELTQLGLAESVGVSIRRPDATRLAAAWRGLPAALKDQLLAEPPQPAYLRPPHVTEAKSGHPLLRGK
jgi:hypothetical protein